MLVYFSIPWGGLAKIFSKGPFSPWGIRGKSPAYTSLYATSRLRVWPKGKKLLLGRAAAFRKTCLWGGLPQRRGLRVLLLAASLLEKTGASCGCTAKTLRPPSFLFFDRLRRFSLFFKRGARGISGSPAAFRLDSGWAKRYNNTIKWESAFSPAPLVPRDR